MKNLTTPKSKQTPSSGSAVQRLVRHLLFNGQANIYMLVRLDMVGPWGAYNATVSTLDRSRKASGHGQTPKLAVRAALKILLPNASVEAAKD
jgi:hypothetical protein